MEKPIQQVQQYIQDNLYQPLSTPHLAEVACLSPVHFHRSFKASTGFTPALFVELHKLRRSLELLKDNVQVQDVAYQLGFANYETFSRAFKKHCKIAPADLQYLLYRLKEETDPDKPLVLSSSRKPKDLQYLVKDAIERKILMPDQLHRLEVCIIKSKGADYRIRKPAEKYQLSFEHDLARELRSTVVI